MWGAWFLLAVLAGVVGLLAIPIEMEFSVRRREGRQEGRCAVGWLFGVVKMRVFPRQTARHSRIQPREAHAESKGAGRILSLLQVRGLPSRLLRLGRQLRRCVRIRELSLNVRMGLDDPADTGRLWSMMGPLAVALPVPSVARIAITPDFAGEALDIDAHGRVRMIPLQLLAVILAFVLSPAALRAARVLRSRPP